MMPTFRRCPRPDHADQVLAPGAVVRAGPLGPRRLDFSRPARCSDWRFCSTKPFAFPGTNIRFGFDGIIGLVPGLGDVLAGLLSLIIPLAAWIRGVPYVTLVRMAANIGIGVLVGSIPLLGDIFDIAWKANRRNYLLLRRHLGEPRRHTWRDWTFLLLLAACAGADFRHSGRACCLASGLAVQAISLPRTGHACFCGGRRGSGSS